MANSYKCPWQDCGFMFDSPSELEKHIRDLPHEGIVKQLVLIWIQNKKMFRDIDDLYKTWKPTHRESGEIG